MLVALIVVLMGRTATNLLLFLAKIQRGNRIMNASFSIMVMVQNGLSMMTMYSLAIAEVFSSIPICEHMIVPGLSSKESLAPPFLGQILAMVTE